MTTEGHQPTEGPQPGYITGKAFRELQAGGPPEGPDFKAAIDAVHGGELPKPDSIAAAAFAGGGREDPVEDALREESLRKGAGRIQRGISQIFERISGGVTLRAKEAFHLTEGIVSRAAKDTVFGQNLTSSLDYALHHKKEIVIDAVVSAVGGGVAGGLGKAAVRVALAGTGGLLATAAIGAVGGAAAGGVTEYLRQRKKIDIDKAEGTLIISGLWNEFRRIKGADKKKIRNAAVRGAVFGAIGGIIGAEIADNEWVQEQISKIRLPGIKLPEVKLPEIRPPEFEFKGAAPADLPPSQALGFPEVSSPVVAPAEATVAPVAPTVEPTATSVPAVATPTAVEATATPAPMATASPTGTPIPTETPTPVPTGTPTPEAAPGPAPAIKPPAAPELAPAQPPAAPEPKMPAAPPVAASAEAPAAPPAPPVTAEPAAAAPPGTEPAIGQPAGLPPTEPFALVEPAPAPPVELAALPEQIPLPAGSNPWEVTSRTLRDVLGRDPTNAEILQVTKEVCRQSNISVPNWEIAGEIDHRALPVDYKLVFNDPVKKLIAGMKG